MIPIWGFVAVTVPLVMTPGMSTAIVLRNAVAGGTRAGIVTAIGVNAGSLGYGLLSAFGFSVALQRWPAAWSVLRIGGVMYLAWLGLQSLRRAMAPAASLGASAPPSRATSGAQRDPDRQPQQHATGSLSPAQSFREGFLTNTLNPAIATYYLVVLPQFIPRGAPIPSSAMLLTAIHIGLAASWHIAWAAAGSTLSRVLSGGRPRQLLEATTGVMLLGLAVKSALG
jgi:threonine/homoserine/homoserine lactone efflux protein